MNKETKFKELTGDQKFQFLYYSVKANERFTLKWIEENLKVENKALDGYDTIVLNALDYLKKLFFPRIEVVIVKDKEIMLNGLADEILMLIEEISDTQSASNGLRIITSLTSLEALYTLVVDCFFCPSNYDLDDNSCQVILLAALANFIPNNYVALKPNMLHNISWKDLSELENSYPKLNLMVDDFMEDIFLKFVD